MTSNTNKTSDFWKAVRNNAKLQHQTAIKPVSRDKNIPLSFGQERIWSIEQLQTDNVAHNLRAVFQLTGELEVAILEKSFQEIIQRHEILRTTFTIIDEKPVQIIVPELIIKLSIEEIQQADIKNSATKEAQQVFDLTKGPLLRIKLLRLAKDEHILLLTTHHMINDRWSTSLFIRELATLYAAFIANKPASLPKLPIQYADFAQFQRLQKLDSQLDYWRQQLKGELPVLQLPTDFKSQIIPTYQGATQYLTLSNSLVTSLKALAKQEGISLYVVLLTVFKILLYQYSQQEDIITCSPIAGRYRIETKKLIGYFSNLVLIRANLAGNPSFKELAKRVSQVTLDINQNQDLPLQKLANSLNISSQILSRTLFALQNVPNQPAKMADIDISSLDIEEGIANFDLFLSMKPKGEEIISILRYKTELFKQATIIQLLANFQTLLEKLVKNPNIQLTDLPCFETVQLTDIIVDYVAPRKESEQIIAKVWQEVLQQEKIGIYANFFDIGGRSLAVVAVCDKLQKLFDREIAVAELFKSPTISAMAQYLSKKQQGQDFSKIRDRTAKQKMANQKRMMKLRKRVKI
ncbi:MAG: condensation domain-containing protein [Candidatus Marithrix sp.]